MPRYGRVKHVGSASKGQTSEAWHTAPAEGITAFPAANANVWAEISAADPGPWTLRLATAAEAWRTHRMSR
ncbi:hypothetical protein SBADM41S_01199 [Streptomyces badius]